MHKITFIGAGNMASSIIGGLIAKGSDPKSITASDPNEDNLKRLSAQYGINTQSDNNLACQAADTLVLAVKPQILKAVCTALSAHLPSGALVISIAAGITCTSLQEWLGDEVAVVRCMPNTPALVGQGASGLFANSHVSDTQKQAAETLMNAVGNSIWLESEALIDSVTAVSGSGPAYFFLFMEAMIEAGVKQGLSLEQAQQLTLQTAAGAATLAQQSDVDVAELRRRVTSPGGTTAEAVQAFEAAGLRSIVDKAMAACADRSKAMAKELS